VGAQYTFLVAERGRRDALLVRLTQFLNREVPNEQYLVRLSPTHKTIGNYIRFVGLRLGGVLDPL
jgi:hypothetical protein